MRTVKLVFRRHEIHSSRTQRLGYESVIHTRCMIGNHEKRAVLVILKIYLSVDRDVTLFVVQYSA